MHEEIIDQSQGGVRRNVKFELEPSPFKVAPNLVSPSASIITPSNPSRPSYINPWGLLGRDQHDLSQNVTSTHEDTINQRTFSDP